MEEVCVTIIHRGKKTTRLVRKGLGFQALHSKSPTPLEFDCREADCGICIFKVLEGGENLSSMTERERDFLQAMRADPSERLGCQTRIFGPCTIEVESYS
ncbi:MAG: 2Fe-2S iron-sulfur cluster-binding protein [Oligoflexales bacterium]